MARNNQAREERIKATVAAILADEEARGLGDGPETIDDIENEMIEIGDLVAREFGKRRLARHSHKPCENPLCPRCGSPGEIVGESTRELVTSRGSIPVTEAKCRYPKCRRLFFPSDRSVGA
jgi:hypothetical protein